MRKLLGLVVGLIAVVGLVPAPAHAGPLNAVPMLGDRITWIDTPTYTLDNGYYRIDSRFKVRSVRPVTDSSQILISFRAPGQFISAGLGAPVFQEGAGKTYHYTTGFPVSTFPAPGTYKVNSVCRYAADGTSRCRPASATEAVDLVIPLAS